MYCKNVLQNNFKDLAPVITWKDSTMEKNFFLLLIESNTHCATVKKVTHFLFLFDTRLLNSVLDVLSLSGIYA